MNALLKKFQGDESRPNCDGRQTEVRQTSMCAFIWGGNWILLDAWSK